MESMMREGRRYHRKGAREIDELLWGLDEGRAWWREEKALSFQWWRLWKNKSEVGIQVTEMWFCKRAQVKEEPGWESAMHPVSWEDLRFTAIGWISFGSFVMLLLWVFTQDLQWLFKQTSILGLDFFFFFLLCPWILSSVYNIWKITLLCMVCFDNTGRKFSNTSSPQIHRKSLWWFE